MRTPIVLSLAAVLTLFLGACKETGKTIVAVDGNATMTRPVMPVTPTNFVNALSLQLNRTPLDYADASNWACSSVIANDVCHTHEGVAKVHADASVSYEEFAEPATQPIDCFYVYPTVNPNLTIGNVDQDYRLVPDAVIQAQAARFSQVCRVFAPYYRQANVGAYISGGEAAQTAFKNAYLDVAAAFEYYLRNLNHGRPFVVMGHSQGAQHVTYLLHQYFDERGMVTDIPGLETPAKLRAKLVAALPIAFNVYVPKGQAVGGSLSDVPVCQSFVETGCVVTYRSYAEGLTFGPGWEFAKLVDQALAAEGFMANTYDRTRHELACVNPSFNSVPSGDRVLNNAGFPVVEDDTRVLDGTLLPYAFNVTTESFKTGRQYVGFPGRYAATCRKDFAGDYYLAIGFHEPGLFGWDKRGDPYAIRVQVAVPLGLHLIDFNLALDDLVAQVRTKTENYLAAQSQVAAAN